MPRALTPEQMARAKARDRQSLGLHEEGLTPDGGGHPSRGYFAKAMPAQEGGWTGQYGIPGLYASRVRDDEGEIAIFDTEEEAEAAAATRMIQVLNARNDRLSVRAKHKTYTPLTPGEMAGGLAEANITVSLFADLIGTPLSRVNGWLTGPTAKDDNNIPHWVRVILALFASNQNNIVLAERVTEMFSEKKER